MKKIISNNRLIAIALLTVFSLATAPAAFANGGKEIPVELKYMGNIKNQHIFQLNVNGSAEQDEFTITIRDEYGNQVYRENIKAESFTKKFLFNTDELSEASLQFEVFSKKTKKSVVYAINSNTRQIEEVVVSELK